MLCLPLVVSAEVVRVATLVDTPFAFSVPSPSGDVPSKNLTLPVVAAPPPNVVTVAVKVTDWPAVEGFVADVSVVKVGHPLTVTPQ